MTVEFTDSALQTIFERNLSAFRAFARERGAEVDEDGRLVVRGVTLSSDVSRDLAEYLEKLGWDDVKNLQLFWRHLMFVRNLNAIRTFIKTCRAYWGATWHMESVAVLLAKGQYLQRQPAAFERPLTDEEIRELWVSLVQGVLGVSKPHEYMFDCNLCAFIHYARERGARVEDGRLVYKGVALTRRVRRKFKRVGIKSSDLISRIQRDIEDAGGREKPVDPKEIWYRMVERNREIIDYREEMYKLNLDAWRRFVSDKDGYYDIDGWLVFHGKRLIANDEEFLRQQPAVYERLLSEKEFEALWDLLLFAALKRKETIGK